MKNNFNSVTLLCCNEVKFVSKYNKEYIMHLPVLKDKIEEFDFDVFISFCANDLEEINAMNNSRFTSKLSLVRYYKKNNMEILTILNHFFAKYLQGFQYVDDSLYWGDLMINKEIFEMFCNYCAIAAGVKSIEDLKLVVTEDMDEFEKKQIEMEKKIKKTKQKDKSKVGQNASLDKILTGVSQEFGYKYSELYNMTLYSIYFMYSNLGSIANYEIGNIAAGNGLLKKSTQHKHWAY